MHQLISDTELAKEFLRINAVGNDARTLVRAVERWLARAGLQHRDPFAVAEEAIHLSAASRPLAPEPVEPHAQNGPDPLAAFTADVQSGISDLNAQAVRDMSMAEYAALRARLGIGRQSGVGVLGPIQ